MPDKSSVEYINIYQNRVKKCRLDKNKSVGHAFRIKLTIVGKIHRWCWGSVITQMGAGQGTAEL